MAQLSCYRVLMAKIMPGVGLFPRRGKECDFWWDSYFKITTAGSLDVQICPNLPVYVLFVIEVPKCALTTTGKCGKNWIFSPKGSRGAVLLNSALPLRNIDILLTRQGPILSPGRIPEEG